MDFIYLYKNKRCSFTLKGIAHLKTKEQFKEVFDGKLDVNSVWKDIEKARPKKKRSED